ncbi:hypothetical protein HanXRQr2_Chr16g0740671 [Helianthus annuus]|uniref:Uncharacterized protein n=1 Tax=Helianthus annuus TaxID=4232 RepID=A0A9K3GY21_HELAN|nr:hypothetical protein HanXRQr2_Chr16g0740671 [Helianthus annuus]KAJ0437600.1 hypothetical protein HanHA300_Chr16g0604031 [Helianthus annuus]KAJ0459927.1 hypothetical protein HanHA89_Chr16g0654671 [Helianthus annuus]
METYLAPTSHTTIGYPLSISQKTVHFIEGLELKIWKKLVNLQLPAKTDPWKSDVVHTRSMIQDPIIPLLLLHEHSTTTPISFCVRFGGFTQSISLYLKIKIKFTMWKFVFLVMMVLTRTMPEEDSRGPTNQSVAIESASNIVPRSTRRRKRNAATTTDVDQPQVDPPKRRGPNLNLSATKDFENLPEGFKIALTMAGGTKGFVGKTATQFANEIGIVVRSVCPMNYHKWESIPALMYEKLQVNRAFMGYVDYRLHRQWTRTRGELSAHWKKNGGKTNPRLARSMMKSNCRSLEDWNHLCDYWELESTRVTLC